MGVQENRIRAASVVDAEGEKHDSSLFVTIHPSSISIRYQISSMDEGISDHPRQRLKL